MCFLCESIHVAFPPVNATWQNQLKLVDSFRINETVFGPSSDSLEMFIRFYLQRLFFVSYIHIESRECDILGTKLKSPTCS